MEDKIKSVGLAIHSNDGEVFEIPLEVWQVGAIADLLGIVVDLKTMTLDKEMFSEELVNAWRDIFRKAAPLLPIEYWPEYFDYVKNYDYKFELIETPK